MHQQLYRIGDHESFPARIFPTSLLDTRAEKIADKFPVGAGSPDEPGFAPLKQTFVGNLLLQVVQKFLTDPENIPLVGFCHFIGKQGPVADTGRNQDDITLLEAVSLRTYQIFRTAAVAAADQFKKAVAVELNTGIGKADILVGVHKPGFHFQFLIEICRIQTDLAQECSPLCRIGGCRLRPVL